MARRRHGRRSRRIVVMPRGATEEGASQNVAVAGNENVATSTVERDALRLPAACPPEPPSNTLFDLLRSSMYVHMTEVGATSTGRIRTPHALLEGPKTISALRHAFVLPPAWDRLFEPLQESPDGPIVCRACGVALPSLTDANGVLFHCLSSRHRANVDLGEAAEGFLDSAHAPAEESDDRNWIHERTTKGNCWRSNQRKAALLLSGARNLPCSVLAPATGDFASWDVTPPFLAFPAMHLPPFVDRVVDRWGRHVMQEVSFSWMHCTQPVDKSQAWRYAMLPESELELRGWCDTGNVCAVFTDTFLAVNEDLDIEPEGSIDDDPEAPDFEHFKGIPYRRIVSCFLTVFTAEAMAWKRFTDAHLCSFREARPDALVDACVDVSRTPPIDNRPSSSLKITAGGASFFNPPTWWGELPLEIRMGARVALELRSPFGYAPRLSDGKRHLVLSDPDSITTTLVALLAMKAADKRDSERQRRLKEDTQNSDYWDLRKSPLPLPADRLDVPPRGRKPSWAPHPWFPRSFSSCFETSTSSPSHPPPSSVVLSIACSRCSWYLLSVWYPAVCALLKEVVGMKHVSRVEISLRWAGGEVEAPSHSTISAAAAIAEMWSTDRVRRCDLGYAKGIRRPLRSYDLPEPDEPIPEDLRQCILEDVYALQNDASFVCDTLDFDTAETTADMEQLLRERIACEKARREDTDPHDLALAELERPRLLFKFLLDIMKDHLRDKELESSCEIRVVSDAYQSQAERVGILKEELLSTPEAQSRRFREIVEVLAQPAPRSRPAKSRRGCPGVATKQHAEQGHSGVPWQRAPLDVIETIADLALPKVTLLPTLFVFPEQ